MLTPVSAAAAATGDVDTSWGNGGVPYAPVDASQQLLSDAQGRVVTVGDRDGEQVARLRADGMADAAFASIPVGWTAAAVTRR